MIAAIVVLSVLLALTLVSLASSEVRRLDIQAQLWTERATKRQDQADAWDDGRDAGPWMSNPYREEETDPTA